MKVNGMGESFFTYIHRMSVSKNLMITCGLPATGKTRAADIIGKEKGYILIRTDILRFEVLRGEDIFDAKVASNERKKSLVYDELFRLADELSSSGENIILDATFMTQGLRKMAAEIAAKNRFCFTLQETRCPRETSLKRIAERNKDHYESNALTEEAYLGVEKHYEKTDIKEIHGHYPFLPMNHFLIDTSSDKVEEWWVMENEIE
jgi:predicted kinase